MDKQLTFGSPIDGLLDRLYEQSFKQIEEMTAYFTARAKEGSLDWNRFDPQTDQFLSDKLVALDRNKAEFCYQVAAACEPHASSRQARRSGSRLFFSRSRCKT